jgi:hypothetical protein
MPRALAPKAGLRGPAQEIFPEDAKQEGRNVALLPEYVTVLRDNGAEDEGGAPSGEWEDVGTWDGRLDVLGARGMSSETAGDEINEATTHIVSMDPEAKGEVKTSDRLRIEGELWIITGISTRSGASSLRLLVRKLHG